MTITQDTTFGPNAVNAPADTIYIIEGDITVYHPQINNGTVTLTIEPGVELRFASGTGIQVGTGDWWNHYYGALVAVGGATAAERIRFTSTAASPTPGSWKGIYFTMNTDNGVSRVERCDIAYGGQTHNANVYLYSAAPVLQENTITHSSSAGIRVYGGSGEIRDNTITDNGTGISVEHSAAPTIDSNTIQDNSQNGISLNNATPTIMYNTIQTNNNSGISVSGSDSNGAVIRYNEFSQNPYGIYTTGSAQPAINYNNFVGNTSYGVYNADSSVVVDAEHNWWGADSGPFDDSDDTATGGLYNPFGNGEPVSDFVDYDPWEGGEIENSLPYDPHTPTPADGAVNVLLDAGTVTLSWIGGDPDAWDNVEYDVYWGLAADTLTNVGTTNPDEAQFVKDSVAEGTTYFWQIVARDTAGATASSPVWQLTTQGQPPDLVVASITWEPATAIEADQQVTFSATIQNVGAGPVVDAFQVEFQVDSASLGTVPVAPILYPNDSVTLTHTWIATAGSHTITVVADSTDTVFEDTNEGNNDHAEMLEVLDVLPPEVVSLVPEDGASLQQLSQIVITVADQHGTVDDAAVIASIEVRDSSNQLVAGTVSESNDSFTFTPDLSPFADGTYTLSFTAKDTASNEQAHTASFIVDAAPPAAPTITGGTITPTGVIQVRPFENQSTSSSVMLTGTRENNTSVWINNDLKLDVGSGNWSVTLSLTQGDNALEVFLQDAAGNPSDSVWIDIFVDSVAPAITSLDPADGSFLTTAPTSVVIVYQEATSGINWGASVLTLTDSSMTTVPGNWDTSVADQITFTPDAGFTEDTYTLEVRLEDALGNNSPLTQAQFTVDAQPPAAPTITGGEVLSGLIQERPFQNQSTSATVTLTGTREDETSVWINGEQKVDVGSDDWSVNLSLPEGDNELEIFLQDQADNPSDSVWVDMFVDSMAPAITAVTPEDNSFFNASTIPTAVIVDYLEETSDLDVANSVSVLRDGGMAEVPGTWVESGGNQLTFTPDTPLVESAYTIVLQLTDQLGNQSSVIQSHFTVDATPPPDPVVDFVSPVPNPQQIISGSKEVYAAIILIEGQDETEIVGHTPSTSWQYPVTLVEDDNPFTFKARDRAGNDSGEVPVLITYTNTPPLPVTTLTVDGVGDGTRAGLDWNGYDESEHGDIISYRIYAETSEISGVDDLQTLLDEVSTGTFTYIAENLSKGATYWFAVVPVDATDKTPAEVYPASVTLSDTVPPEDVTNVQVQCFADRLIFTWDASANSTGDLSGYNVYFNGASTAEFLPAGTTSSEKTGLTLATAYPFTITAVDNENNESSGVSITGITLLDNPTGLSVTDEQSGYVTITWTPIDAAQQSHLKHYAVYVSDTDFFTVEGLTPWQTTTTTTTGVAGLTNEVIYYITVTAVNHADGERQSPVTTVTATPQPDTQGPTISPVTMDEVALNDGDTVPKPVKFSVEVSDPSGMSRVEFAIDGTVLRKDYNGNPNYFCYWNVIPISDDSYTLDITAYDTLGNSSAVSYTLNVALGPPPAPAITQPESGLLTNETTITVSGTAALSSEVLLFNNSTQVGEAVAVDSGGHFTIPLTLAEGANQIQAQARYRGDGGPISTLSDPAVTVTRDTSLPSAPTNLTAQSRAGGEIKLTWRAPTEMSIKGYKLYRAIASFTTIAEAELINATNLLTGTTYYDLPATDGEYFYRVITVSDAENESDLSEDVSAHSDREGPTATEISYRSATEPLPSSGPFPPGTVLVTLTVSEPLQTTPFLSITPENGFPISLDLTLENSPLEGGQGGVSSYSGSFEITESTPTGTAYAVFSARDLAGNRGTEVETGASFEIDTDGPAVIRLVIQPEHPIRNDAQNPVSVTVTIGLDEALKSGEVPELSYELSGPGRVPVAIATLTQVTPEGDEAQAWQGSFTLPSDAGTPGTAGAPPAEYLSFIYQGVDALENIGDTVCADGAVASGDACGTSFQIYQGDLPALPVPTGLAAESLPGGQINLTWNPVEHAAEYQLYRQAPGESELTAYQRVVPQTSPFAFLDEPTVDGTYTYAVASVRQENTQESLSEMSDPVEAVSDAMPPAAPQNLTVTPVSQGIFITWDDPQNSEPVTYRLYRASGTDITPEDIETLIPIIPEIPAQYLTTGFLDPNPSTTEPCYAMTAIDALGNESAPSNSVYHNVGLLPVSDLHVRQQDNDLPVVSWNHPSAGSMAGYDISVGPEGQEVKLNTTLLTDRTYTDTGYAGEERRYSVIAVDTNNAESLPHSITLPTVRPELVEGSIKRGIMNRLEYQVENLSSNRIANIRLNVVIEGKDEQDSPIPHAHTSTSFNLEPGETTVIPVTIGGYADLPDLAALTTTVEITPNAGETVEIIRTSEIEVGNGMLVAQILNEEFTHGVTGTVRFTLENTGEEDIEILTASGNGASSDIWYYLLDGDGNVLSSAPYTQLRGEGLVKLANGNTVARIPVGGTFTSEPTTLAVPPNAPDRITVQVAINHLYFHQGLSDQVIMDGLSTTHQVSLIDTAYYGEVLDITPESSWGGEEIVISGRAVERATGEPMPEVPLKLTISVAGFDRTKDIFTGSDGTFTYIFTPLSGESGIYTVRVMHPDLRDRPVHGTFVIQRVGVTPAAIDLELEKNYQQTIGIQVKTGEGTTLTNLRLVYDEADQPGGVFPQGVHVTLEDPDCQLPTANCQLPFTVWADNTADETTTLVLRVVSDECHDETCPVSGQQEWETIVIDAAFSDPAPPTPPQPYLFVTPGYVETGVAHDESITEIVTLKNQGNADLSEVSLALLSNPEWVSLNSPAHLDVIPAGGQREVRLLFSPTAAVPEGQHTVGTLRIESPDVPAVEIGLYATVMQSGEGNALLKVSDIYTGTLDDQGQLIQGLAGARITIQNEVVTSITQTSYTDSTGETLFEDLPSGRYRYRITAPNHQEQIGRLWIKTGLTTSEEIFLEYNLVTVEWEVTEITIEDRYEITLQTTYETDVPAAVVVVDPASVSLPPMEPGDVFQGELTLTNHGLIRADHLQLLLPDDDVYFRYELLGGVPESLGPKQHVTVPYRVTMLQGFDQEGSGDGTGGGCERYLMCGQVLYDFECVNGHLVAQYITECFEYDPCRGDGDDQGSGSGSGSGSSSGGSTTDEWIKPLVWKISSPKSGDEDSASGSGTAGGGPDFSSSPETLAGTPCYPTCSGKECSENEAPCGQKETCQNINIPVESSVNALARDYRADAPGLSVTVPGGSLSVAPAYREGTWLFGPDRSGLDGLPTETSTLQFFEYGDEEKGYVITSIIKDGNIPYNLPPENFALRKEYAPDGTLISERYEYVGDQIYRHEGAYTLNKTDTGYRWKEKSGDWQDYDEHGRLTAAGNRHGTRAMVLYDSEGRVTGYLDQDGMQVVWVTYQNDRIASLRDADGRQVDYTYDADDRLWKVTDDSGDETEYTYDGEGRLQKVSKPGGREANISYGTDGGVQSVTDEEGEGSSFAFDYDKRKKEYYAMVTSPFGTVKEVWYDEDGNTKRVAIDGETVQTIQQDTERNALIITDASGQETRKEYDEWDNLKKIIYPDGSIATYEYDRRFHQPTKITDRNGMTTVYAYDDSGNLVRQVEAAGTEVERVTEYGYDADGNVIRLVEAAGSELERVTEYTYDADGKLTRLIEAAGSEFERITDYGYDADGLLTMITRHLDESITEIMTLEYDDEGRVSKLITPEGETLYTYDNDGNIHTVQTPRGIWQYEYDDEGRTTKITNPRGKTTEQIYDVEGNVIGVKITDQFGNITEREYNVTGKLISVTVNGNIESTYTYDDDNKLLQYTDRGATYRLEYNTDGQLVRKIDPEGKQKRYEYYADGRLWKIIDGNDNEIIWEYGDTSGSETSCTSCSGGSSSVKQLQRVIYPTGLTKEYHDDAQGRTVEQRYVLPGGETYSVFFSYDAFGRLHSETDKEGNTTIYHYDALGRKIMVASPSGQTHYTYDTWGNLAVVTDAKDQITRFEYDAFGRLKKEIRPMGQETLYEYDEAGGLAKIIDANQHSKEYVYDDETGRLKQYVYRSATEENTITFTYDSMGKLDTVSDGVVSIQYQYDEVSGRKIGETVNYGSFTKSYTYTYYQNGSKKSFTGPDGITYEYTYGDNNELREVQIPGLGAITFSSYAWREPTAMVFPGGNRREYVYDPRMRIQAFTASDPGQNILLDYQYTYDNMGNILSKETEHGTYMYEYDDAYRLTAADNPMQENEAYTYDAVGNRLSASGIPGSWSYNDNNELLGYGNVSYVYDDNGNATQKLVDGQVVMNFIYNIENRLSRVEDGSGNLIASYYYGPFGRRLWKEVGGVRTYFFYSDEGLIGEYDENGAELRTYGYRLDSPWSTSPLFLKQGAEYYFYQNDHLGTPLKIVSGNGTVVWSATYTSFGEAIVDPTSSITNNVRFPGQYYDEETELHYNYHRYYNPTIGRYIQADPIGLDGGINLFAYTDNNPLTRRDIYGLSSCPPPGNDFTGCCGPDVTAALRGAFRQVRQIFDVEETDLFIKWKACTGLLGLDAGKIGKIPQTRPELDLLLSPESEYLPSIDTYKASGAWDTDLWILSQEHSFKLTKKSFENLKNEGIPDEILEALKHLENQEIREEKFLDAVEEQIGEEQTVMYKELILKYAEKVYKKPTDIWPDDRDKIRNGVGEPECERTVTFEERCFHGNHLNYLLFGVMHQRCHQTFIEMRGLQEELHKPFEEEYSRIFQEIAEERKIRLLGLLPELTQFPGGTELINYFSAVNLGKPWSEHFAARLATLFKLNYLISADLKSMSNFEIGFRILERVQTMSIVQQITRAGYQSDRVNVPEPTYHNRCYVDVDHAGSVSSMMWRWEPWWGSISKEESEWGYLPEEE